jgi:hypothetical protein
LIASPETYKVVRSIFGEWVASPEGAATFPGLLLHAFVFVSIVTIIMLFLPKGSFAGPVSEPAPGMPPASAPAPAAANVQNAVSEVGKGVTNAFAALTGAPEGV